MTYLELQRIHCYTGREFWKATEQSQIFFGELLKKTDFPDKINAIYDKHGIDREQWVQVLQRVSTLSFFPTKEVDTINKEIKLLCRNYIVQNDCWWYSYTAASHLCNHIKHTITPSLMREKVNGIWVYSPTEYGFQIIKEIRNYINSLG